MGIGYCADKDGEEIEFWSNVITELKRFDYINMFACSYLNLRGSSISDLEAHKLYSLIYIDISFCKIKKSDCRACENLLKMVKD